MVCTVHRLQCKTLHFPKHKFLFIWTRNVQTHLKLTVTCIYLFPVHCFLTAVIWWIFGVSGVSTCLAAMVEILQPLPIRH